MKLTTTPISTTGGAKRVQPVPSIFREYIETRICGTIDITYRYRYYEQKQSMIIYKNGKLLAGIIGNMAHKQWANIISKQKPFH